MVEKVFNQNSETTRGYVIINNSQGIDFVRLDEGTIAYRINTEEWVGDWELESNLNDESHFDYFIEDLIPYLHNSL